MFESFQHASLSGAERRSPDEQARERTATAALDKRARVLLHTFSLHRAMPKESKPMSEVVAEYRPPDFNAWTPQAQSAWKRHVAKDAQALKKAEEAAAASVDEVKPVMSVALRTGSSNSEPISLKPGEKNRDAVLAAVKVNGLELRFADPKLLQDPKSGVIDRELILAAVEQNGEALAHVPEACKADKEIVLAAVCESGFALGYASPELRADREVVLAAVELDGSALCFASRELREDREVVLAAIEEDGYALKFVKSQAIRAERAVVEVATNTSYRAPFFASRDSGLREDAELLRKAGSSRPPTSARSRAASRRGTGSSPNHSPGLGPL